MLEAQPVYNYTIDLLKQCFEQLLDLEPMTREEAKRQQQRNLRGGKYSTPSKPPIKARDLSTKASLKK